MSCPEIPCETRAHVDWGRGRHSWPKKKQVCTHRETCSADWGIQRLINTVLLNSTTIPTFHRLDSEHISLCAVVKRSTERLLLSFTGAELSVQRGRPDGIAEGSGVPRSSLRPPPSLTSARSSEAGSGVGVGLLVFFFLPSTE